MSLNQSVLEEDVLVEEASSSERKFIPQWLTEMESDIMNTLPSNIRFPDIPELTPEMSEIETQFLTNRPIIVQVLDRMDNPDIDQTIIDTLTTLRDFELERGQNLVRGKIMLIKASEEGFMKGTYKPKIQWQQFPNWEQDLPILHCVVPDIVLVNGHVPDLGRILENYHRITWGYYEGFPYPVMPFAYLLTRKKGYTHIDSFSYNKKAVNMTVNQNDRGGQTYFAEHGRSIGRGYSA